MYFDHCSGTARTQIQVKLLFYLFFNIFLVFGWKINKNWALEITKKVENSPKRYFNQLSGARSTGKLVKMNNNSITFFQTSEWLSLFWNQKWASIISSLTYFFFLIYALQICKYFVTVIFWSFNFNFPLTLAYLCHGWDKRTTYSR